MPIVTGKKQRYIEMIALGTRPTMPMEPRITMIIGAMARIGTACEAMIQGMRLRSSVRTWTMPSHNATVGNQSVLLLDDAQAQPVIDFFKGSGPEPADPAPTPGNAVPLARALQADQTDSCG